MENQFIKRKITRANSLKPEVISSVTNQQNMQNKEICKINWTSSLQDENTANNKRTLTPAKETLLCTFSFPFWELRNKYVETFNNWSKIPDMFHNNQNFANKMIMSYLTSLH